MRKLKDLNIGFSDAENYKRRENKQIFQKLFVQNDFLERLLDPNISFLIGEKGTGKTAYSIFLSNSDYKEHKSTLKFLRETEYHKFVELKKSHSLSLSDYTEIWKTIILLLFAESLADNLSSGWFNKGKQEVADIKKAIDEFYENAFSPELIVALQLVEHSEIAAKIVARATAGTVKSGVEIGAKTAATETSPAHRFQTNLLFIRRKLEYAIGRVKVAPSFIMFIDGIDIRPSSISFEDYLDCIKGLANAVWTLNNDFFSSIKDSKGRFRAVLLVRPDIFLKLGLQNPNTKARDNAVVLDWITTYKQHRSSKIFEVVDNLLSSQQESRNIPFGSCWDHYFPFDVDNVKEVFVGSHNSFIWFLRYSLYRPRDLFTYLAIFKKHLSTSELESNTFPKSLLELRDVSNEYAEYLLGELRDQLLFYYSDSEYEDFLQFFDFLNGHTRFDYDAYTEAYSSFLADAASRGKKPATFLSSANAFLQFLYEMNVISYSEKSESGDLFIHWCFRERSQGKLAPKVKAGLTYEVHYGLVPALNMGKPLVVRKKK